MGRQSIYGKKKPDFNFRCLAVIFKQMYDRKQGYGTDRKSGVIPSDYFPTTLAGKPSPNVMFCIPLDFVGSSESGALYSEQ